MRPLAIQPIVEAKEIYLSRQRPGCQMETDRVMKRVIRIGEYIGQTPCDLYGVTEEEIKIVEQSI